MNNSQYSMLIDEARKAKESSYSPYSHFSVGAALLCADGKIYRGCNIENASFTPTCCAERVAFYSAIADGERTFSAIAVVGDKSPCMPCGVCRQVMSEFCDKDFKVIVVGQQDKIEEYSLLDLLPFSFAL